MRLSQGLILYAIQLNTWASVARAQCPFAGGLHARDEDGGQSRDFLENAEVSDGDDDYMTSDVGGPFTEQRQLRAGERGPTLMEDFQFRQKMMHFDHERVSISHHSLPSQGIPPFWEQRTYTRNKRFRSALSMPVALVHMAPSRATATSAT